jgi:Zn-finger nucleic acid-binding protein
MKCPACKSHTTNPTTLACGLQALACTSCDGQWVKSFEYWRWRDQQGDAAPAEAALQNIPETDADSAHAMMCPECSTLLSRYQVGHGVSFYVDRCGRCGGMWFDKNEWDVLVAHDLHTDAHFISSAPWQAEIVKAARAEARDKTLAKKLGAERYAALVAVKEWLDTHPQRSAALAFLGGE